MRLQPWHPSPGPRPKRDGSEEFDSPWDDLLIAADEVRAPERADCCPGAAAYRIVLPRADGRAGRRELLLCAHHYRSGRAGLERTAAAVFDVRGRLVASYPVEGPADGHARQS